MSTRILVVDDHILFREGLISLLGNQPDFTIAGEAGSARKAIAMALDLKPDVVLMDITLPDGNGLEATRSILLQLPDTKIVMLTIHESDDLMIAAMRAGAKGYLLKDTPVMKVLASLRALIRGEVAISRAMMSRLLDEFTRLSRLPDPEVENLNGHNLTPRELEVLDLLGSDASNREIADHLFISENTVKIHVHNVLDKLQLQNRRQAGNFARRLGLGKRVEYAPLPDLGTRPL
jgi:DNA-binding NarL/FixJ family response regulator